MRVGNIFKQMLAQGEIKWKIKKPFWEVFIGNLEVL